VVAYCGGGGGGMVMVVRHWSGDVVVVIVVVVVVVFSLFLSLSEIPGQKQSTPFAQIPAPMSRYDPLSSIVRFCTTLVKIVARGPCIVEQAVQAIQKRRFFMYLCTCAYSTLCINRLSAVCSALLLATLYLSGWPPRYYAWDIF
jgi:hypothetical protein